MKKYWNISTQLWLVSGILFIYCFFVWRKESSFINQSSLTKGQVFQFQKIGKSGNHRNDTIYYPQVSFMVNGQEYQFVSNLGSSSKRFELGEKVEVYYNPIDPTKAQIKDYWESWFGFIASLIVGAGFCLMGFLTWFLSTRHQLKELESKKRKGN